LSRNHASSRVGIALGCNSCLNTRPVRASVNVADLHASLLVNGHVKEVEQIPADVGAAVTPDATTLHWVLRCHVVRCPMQSSVECAGNVKMPDTTEAICC